VLSDSAFDGNRIFADDGDSAFHTPPKVSRFGFRVFNPEPETGCLLKTAELAVADLDLHLVEQVPDFLGRHVALLGDFKGHGAGNFAVLGRIFQLGNDFFLIHAFPS
jgi:hypothetical protein